MRLGLALLLSFSIAQSAVAQDDWSSFPSSPTPPPKAAPPTPPAVPPPSPRSKAPPAPKPPKPSTSAKQAEPAQPPLEASPEQKILSSSEKFLPGDEPHSPSTFRNTWNAPSNLRHTPGVTGGLGLLHVSGADLGEQGLLRFSAVGEYFARGNFPVLGATNTRTAGTFAVSFVPLSFLEVYLSYAAAANTNSNSSPRLIQTLGDIGLGLKGARRWAKGFHAGVDLRLTTFSGVGNQDLSRIALGVAPKAVATYDFREAFPKVPVRLHGNLGLVFDGTGQLVSSHELVAAEEFALGTHAFNRFTFGAGLEVPLPVVTPFLEYNLAAPLGVPAAGLEGPDGLTVDAAAAMPQTLGLGVKVTAIKDLTLSLAMDFGLSRRVGLGIPATPPFNFLFGAAFNVDPFQRGGTKVVETIREKPVEVADKTGKVSGTVLDAQTKKPLPGVIVAMVGAGLPPVASDVENGHFLTHELPSGPVKLSVFKDGYKQTLREVMLAAGETATVELALERDVRKAVFAVSVTSKKKPVAATVALKGASEQQVPLTEANTEPLKVPAPHGKYVVTVKAPGYLSQTREVQVTEGAEMALAFDLTPEPKKWLVVVKENKIEILQQVRFATGKATILPNSYSLLAQVVDAIIKSDIKRIRVEGHTDNRGNKKKNQRLSEDRAKAVAEFLEKAGGIERSRLETEGFGDTRPLAPNLTARGRELNRRVEFVILER